MKRPITSDDVADAFQKGAYWADKTMIEKACEWIQKEVLEDYPYIIWPDIVKDFRKAMEE